MQNAKAKKAKLQKELNAKLKPLIAENNKLEKQIGDISEKQIDLGISLAMKDLEFNIEMTNKWNELIFKQNNAKVKLQKLLNVTKINDDYPIIEVPKY